MAKSVCKIEHGFLLGNDIVKEAAKQASVETFDQVRIIYIHYATAKKSIKEISVSYGFLGR